MKALPMFDHVMLWVARLFTTLYPVFLAALFWSTVNNPEVELDDDYVIKGILAFVLFVAWLVCLWSLRSRVARFCLGLSSGVCLAKTVDSVVFIVPLLRHSFLPYDSNFLAETYLILGIPVVGFASMLWVSIRPPQKFKTSGHNPINNHPLPQSC